VARSDVAGRVEVVTGAGRDVLAGLPERSLDALFLDADKSGYPAYLQEGLRLLRPGGLVMADNAFAFGQLFDAQPTDPEVPAVRAFNDLVAEHVRAGRLSAVIVPVGDGMWVGVTPGTPGER
jgi:predicted O-methyltransferase YrrM